MLGKLRKDLSERQHLGRASTLGLGSKAKVKWLLELEGGRATALASDILTTLCSDTDKSFYISDTISQRVVDLAITHANPTLTCEESRATPAPASLAAALGREGRLRELGLVLVLVLVREQSYLMVASVFWHLPSLHHAMHCIMGGSFGPPIMFDCCCNSLLD